MPTFPIVSKWRASNKLSGITPTFAGWTTNPGSNANIVDETTEALTTNGVGQSADCYVTFDLTSLKRRLAAVRFFVTGTLSFAADLQTSLNGSSWYRADYLTNSEHAYPLLSSVGYFRYVRFHILCGGTAQTINALRMWVYDLE